MVGLDASVKVRLLSKTTLSLFLSLTWNNPSAHTRARSIKYESAWTMRTRMRRKVTHADSKVFVEDPRTSISFRYFYRYRTFPFLRSPFYLCFPFLSRKKSTEIRTCLAFGASREERSRRFFVISSIDFDVGSILNEVVAPSISRSLFLSSNSNLQEARISPLP